LERGVGHHVQEADVQLTNVLMLGAVERQQLVPLLVQVAEGR